MKLGYAKLLQYLTLLLFSLFLVSCLIGGGGGGDGNTSATAVIGPAGGTLTGPDGVQVVVPAGALDQPTTIGIARSAAGAPAALVAYPAAGHIYEFTPHDLPFNLPVTIRMPVPGGASGTLFMASPGQDWNVKDATVVNGVAEWARNSFSWVYWSSWAYPSACFIPVSMLNDPYWCGVPNIGASLSATPPQALTQTPVYPRFYFGRVDQAATLHFQSQVYVPGNCGNVTVELKRRRFNGSTMTWGLPQTISTQSPALTVDGSHLSGTATFDFSFTYQDNGRNEFALDLSTDCPGTLHDAHGDVTGYDYSNYRSTGAVERMYVVGNIAQPTAFYAVGGSVSGLTGAGLGLVLQNNGGDNLPVAADGSFTFATAIADNAPYSVSVQTQPSGPFCTVQNGSGTIASADVTNVAVSCVLPPAISPTNVSVTPPRCSGGSNSTVTFTASGGTPPYSWSASRAGLPVIVGLTVINATQAQWTDTLDYYCDYVGNVTIITVTDSTGASASATIQGN